MFLSSSRRFLKTTARSGCQGPCLAPGRPKARRSEGGRPLEGPALTVVSTVVLRKRRELKDPRTREIQTCIGATPSDTVRNLQKPERERGRASMISSERSRMHRLLEEGMTKAAVARQIGCSRQTLYNWLEEPAEPQPPCCRPSKLDPYKPYIRSRLQRYDLPATVLLREIRE